MWSERETCSLEVGRSVFAFYHSNLHRTRSVQLCSGVSEPLCGLSSGWLPATVLRISDRITVSLAGPFMDPMLGGSDTLELSLPRSLVRTEATRPLLSLLLFRWWDYRSNGTWSDYVVTSDGMLQDILDGPCGVFATLPGDFELYTVFVRASKDLEGISEHWAQAVLQGLNTVAWYFLWPCQGSELPGCVDEKQFFALQQRMERVGIRSGWPHPSALYRQLCGKLWVAQMSLNEAFRVPATVRVHCADVRNDPMTTALTAIQGLLRLCGQSMAVEEFRGVTKLGFSWQGDDVLPFIGPENLARVLQTLLDQPQSEQPNCLAPCTLQLSLSRGVNRGADVHPGCCLRASHSVLPRPLQRAWRVCF